MRTALRYVEEVARCPATLQTMGVFAVGAVSHAPLHPERERLRRKASSAELAYVFWMSDNEPAQHSPNYGGWASFEGEIRARRYA